MSVEFHVFLSLDVWILIRGAVDLSVSFSHLLVRCEKNRMEVQSVFIVRTKEQTSFDGLDRLTRLEGGGGGDADDDDGGGDTHLVEKSEVVSEMKVSDGIIWIELNGSTRRRVDV